VARGLQAQQDGRQRLVDLVVQILRDALALALLGANRRTARVPALLLEALEHPVERQPKALDLARVGVLHAYAPAGVGQVGLLHRVDHLREGSEAAAQQERVAEKRREQRGDEHDHLATVGDLPDVQVHGDRRHEHGSGDQQEVHGEHLSEQRAPAHERMEWGSHPMDARGLAADTVGAGNAKVFRQRTGGACRGDHWV